MKKFTRRAFLATGGLIGGGLILGVAVAPNRSPVVKVVRKLSVAADHEIRLQSRTRETVVPTGSSTFTQG